ncbi:MAG: T9SS type A sorting domain-containing protein, partial [Bacteroidota bacterium]
TAVDPDLRVALQGGLNIVGFTQQNDEAVDSYFDFIIATNDLNVVRTVDGSVVDRVYNVFPFPVGNLFTMRNSLGYIVDVNMSFMENEWRTVSPEGLMTTGVFDQFYGSITNGEQYVGETIEFTDADGNVFGRTEIREGGVYYNAFVFGDLKNTRELTEGFKPAGEIFVRLGEELIETGATFEGAWVNRQLDFELSQLTSTVAVAAEGKVALGVYPNPTNGNTTLTITLDRAEPVAQLEVISGLGQIVATRQLEQLVTGEQQLDLDLSSLPAGTYHVRVFTNERLIGVKQVVRR